MKAKKNKPTGLVVAMDALTSSIDTGRLVANLLSCLPHDGTYIGRKIYGRAGTAFEHVTGLVTGVSRCRLEGCGGDRLHVKWPDGKRTFPCIKGCKELEGGSFQII